MFKNYLVNLILVMSFFVFYGCTVIPKQVKDNVPAFDSSTPKTETNQQNSGFLGFDANGDGVITSNAKNKYNNLIMLYQKSFFNERGIQLEKDYGISDYTDDKGNKLFKITKESLTHFIVLNDWLRNKKPTDFQE